ncbi:MAG: SUMF1/EgtB/PvdO family nonheme iron enzyme, partial [Planctomycetaceae bacterium]|nr:SUMF1/EgtB/PvdO family nonheme iron enzyme [Planctomycetaceae bacterium]
PTEAQWEYACRAGTQSVYCFGDDVRALHKFANYQNAFQMIVGKKVPNIWNLFDMHGNALEWCLDFYQDTYYTQSPISDPIGPDTGKHHVARGGSWRSSHEGCNASARFMRSRPDEDLGFRVALVFTV